MSSNIKSSILQHMKKLWRLRSKSWVSRFLQINKLAISCTDGIEELVGGAPPPAPPRAAPAPGPPRAPARPPPPPPNQVFDSVSARNR
jgi:hypothetical protein